MKFVIPLRDELHPFRTLLKAIAITFGGEKFTARDLSNRMMAAIPPVVLPQFSQRFRTKLISNDPRGLYTMGFLKREEEGEEEMYKTKSGKVCFGVRIQVLDLKPVEVLEYLVGRRNMRKSLRISR